LNNLFIVVLIVKVVPINKDRNYAHILFEKAFAKESTKKKLRFNK
jgi:hypothetical protein